MITALIPMYAAVILFIVTTFFTLSIEEERLMKQDIKATHKTVHASGTRHFGHH